MIAKRPNHKYRLYKVPFKDALEYDMIFPMLWYFPFARSSHTNSRSNARFIPKED